MRRSISSVLGSVALFVAAIALMPTNAGANTYNFSETDVNPSTASCGSGDCFFILAAYAPIFGSAGPVLNAGDVVNVSITFSTPFTVDGATGASAIYAAVLDSNYYNCAGLNVPACMPETPDLATSTETVIGEDAGGPTLTTGTNFTNSGFYSAVAFVTGPNPGFTVTGFDATLTLVNGDAFPLAAVAVESESVDAQSVPEPATLSMLGFGLVGLGLKRRRKTA